MVAFPFLAVDTYLKRWNNGWHCTANSVAASGFVITWALVLKPDRLSFPRPEIGSEVGSAEVRMTWVSFMEPVVESSSGLVIANSSHSFNLPEILFRLTIWNEVSWIWDEMTNTFVSLFSFLKIQFVNLFDYENILFLTVSQPDIHYCPNQESL